MKNWGFDRRWLTCGAAIGGALTLVGLVALGLDGLRAPGTSDVQRRSSAATTVIPGSGAHPPPGAAGNNPLQAQDVYSLCQDIMTGTIRSTFTISNPHGVNGFRDYAIANFEQRVISQSATAIEVEVIARPHLETQASYPVDGTSLPTEAAAALVPQPGWIQSDDAAIVAQARSLVAVAATQAEAVDAILTWVRGSIHYDYTFSLPNDASAVFRNRSGVCAGFSAVATALLRAAGIPARSLSGCVAPFGWVTGPEGGWHAWVDVYYTDVGWVASDPQTTENYVDTSHFFGGFGACGAPQTVITRTAHTDDWTILYSILTDYRQASWPSLQVAANTDWDRDPLQASPNRVVVLVTEADPIRTIEIQVANGSCSNQSWMIRAETPWLAPAVITGTSPSAVHLTLDARGLAVGEYTGQLTLYGSAQEYEWATRRSRSVAVDMYVVDRVYQAWLPQVQRAR